MALLSTLDFFLEEVFRLPIRKSLDPNNPADFAIIAATLAKATAGLAQAEEAKALKKALAALDVDWKTMKPDAKLKVVNAAKAAVNPVKLVLPKIEKEYEANAIKLGIQTKGATKKTFGFQISPDLTAVQVKTLQAVALSQGNYVRDEYGKRSDAFGMKAKQIVAEELAKGTHQKEIVKRLREDLAAQQFNRSAAYWNVVANAFANRARTYTNLSSYEEAGITEFRVESVLDERTSHVCRFMHGKTFRVASGLSAMHESEKPGNDVKTSQPWMSVANDDKGNPTLRAGGQHVATVTQSGMGKVDEPGKFDGLSNAGLEKLGILTPPFHGNCRTTIVPHTSSVSVVVPSFALEPTGDLPPPPPRPELAAPAPAEEQEGFLFGPGGIAAKPLEIHPEQQGLMFGPGGISGKPILVPALDPAAAPIPATIPFKDKAAIALDKLAAMKALPSYDADLNAIPTPCTVKKSPLLGVNKFGFPNDKPTADVLNECLDHWGAGFPGDEMGMKHMPKKLGNLKVIDAMVDASKVEMYLKNPKLINKAMNEGEIVVMKIGKDVFIVKGHDAVAAAQLMDRAELKILEINLKVATEKSKEKAAAAAQALAAAPPPVAVPIPPKPPKPPPPPTPVAAPPPMAAPPPAVPLGAPINGADIMHHLDAGPGGSNPGGFYTGKDGVKRYVKFYDLKEDRGAQAHGEMLANALYGALGHPTPESITWEGKWEKKHKNNLPGDAAQMYASKLLDGTPLGNQITKERAKKFFDGFAADILMCNWDAAGQTCDNAFLLKDGRIARIDNGGSFLNRAQAGRKPLGALHVIGEIESFFPGGSPPNPGYHKLAEAAGYRSVEDFKDGFKKQVAEIDALKQRYGSWSAFVSQYSPGLRGADRDAVVKMLEIRHDLLQGKVRELFAPKPERPGVHQGVFSALSDRKNTGYREPMIDGVAPKKGLKLADIPETKPPGGLKKTRNPNPNVMPNGESRAKYQARADKCVEKIKADEKQAIGSFTGSGYGSIRDSEERGAPDRESDAIQRAYLRAKPEPGTVYRGIKGMDAKVVEGWLAHTDADGPFRLGKRNMGATSSTAWHPDVSAHNGMFMGGPVDHGDGRVKVLFKIHHHSGVPVETISSSGKEECEVLLKKGAEFRIKQVARWEGTKHVIIIELEEI